MNFRNSRLLPSFALVATAVVVLLVYACKRETLEPTIPSSQISSVSTTTKSMSLRQQLMAHTNLSEFLAAYRALSPTQKQEVWTDKFNVMISSENCSSEEKKLIQELLDFIDIKLFEGKREIALTVSFGEDWMARAVSKLGWTEEQAEVAIATLFTHQEYNDRIEETRIGGGSQPQPIGDCQCVYSSGCLIFQGKSYCKRDSICEVTDDGCGFFFQMPCRGLCGSR